MDNTVSRLFLGSFGKWKIQQTEICQVLFLYSSSNKTSFGFCSRSEGRKRKFVGKIMAQKRKFLTSQDSYKGYKDDKLKILL